MSGITKGNWGYNPGYPGTAKTGQDDESRALIAAKWPNTNNLSNVKYERLLVNYYKCTMMFLD